MRRLWASDAPAAAVSGLRGQESDATHGYGYQWTKIRRAFLRANPSCARCGAKAVQVDHKTPRREGGTHAWENLQSLCLKCHQAKSKRERRDGLLASQA